jgi:hypothetical protein
MEFKTVIAYLKNRSILIFVSVIAVLYPLLLVLKGDAYFNIDWYHNMWLIGYFGEYFYRHYSFPLGINASGITNIITPFFYGYLFYPSLGIISSVLGPNITLRLAIVITYSLQFFATVLLIKKLTKNAWMGIGISCLSIWTIYPLTNLYNRSAILEFIAVSLFFTSICIWFLSIISADAKSKMLLRVLFALCLSFSLSSHAITAFYGGGYIGVLFLISILFSIKKKHIWNELLSISMVFIIVLLVLLPWLYITLKFVNHLSITNHFDQNLLFFNGIDQVWVRLSPFPLDMRSILLGIAGLGAPYLDAQINDPLLIYLIFQIVVIIYFRKKIYLSKIIMKNEKYSLTLMVLSCLSLLYFLIVSLSPSAASITLWYLWRAQFAYRFVTYQNLSIFLGIIAIFLFVRKIDGSMIYQPIMRYTLIGCLVLSAQSVLIKLVHAYSIVDQVLGINTEGDGFLKGYGIGRQGKDDLINSPRTMTSMLDYSTGSLGMGQPITSSVQKIDRSFIVQAGDNFGYLKPINLTITEPTIIGVDIESFPWNYILINGKVINRKDTYLSDNRTYIQLNPGKYKITSEVKPDSLWVISRFISLFTIIGCGIYLIVNIRGVKNAISDANIDTFPLLFY